MCCLISSSVRKYNTGPTSIDICCQDMGNLTELTFFFGGGGGGGGGGEALLDEPGHHSEYP